MRVAILGNSGSGKSTLARTLASPAAVPVLDLDTIAWLPTDPPTRSDDHAARMKVLDFCASPGWIVEGCYAGLIEVALAFHPVLLFLDPGAEACVAHCMGREWEPHKYASKAEQDANLPMLVDWVRGYYTRDGELSAIGHRDCFARYAGPKFHLHSDEEAASVANGLLGRCASNPPEAVAMDHQSLLNTLVAYHEAFAEPDAVRRLELLRRSMTPGAEIWGPKRLFAGHEAISEKIEGFHRNWPGCRLALTTGFNVFRNTAHLGMAIIGPDGAVRASGRAVMEFADDGRIRRVLPLWEALPPLPAGWPERFAPGKPPGIPDPT